MAFCLYTSLSVREHLSLFSCAAIPQQSPSSGTRCVSSVSSNGSVLHTCISIFKTAVGVRVWFSRQSAIWDAHMLCTSDWFQVLVLLWLWLLPNVHSERQQLWVKCLGFYPHPVGQVGFCTPDFGPGSCCCRHLGK